MARGFAVWGLDRFFAGKISTYRLRLGSVETSVAEMEAFSAPNDGVSGEAPEPEGEAEEVAQGEEPEVAENLAVA